MVFSEYRIGVQEKIVVAVIKGDHGGVGRELGPLFQASYELFQTYDAPFLREKLDLFFEVFYAGNVVGVYVRGIVMVYAVIHQNHRFVTFEIGKQEI